MRHHGGVNRMHVLASTLGGLVLALALIPSPAHASMSGGNSDTTATTNLTIYVHPEGGMPKQAVTPHYNFKADTWFRVDYNVGMEWQLMWYDALGQLVPVPGHTWSSETTQFDGLLPGTTYVLRSRLRNGDPSDVREIVINTYRVAEAPKIAETGVSWESQDRVADGGNGGPVLKASDDGSGEASDSAGNSGESARSSAWFRVADEGDHSTDKTDPETDAGKSYEWSLDGETWQADPLFTGLEPGTEYQVYARVRGGTIASEPTTVLTPRVRNDGGENGGDNNTPENPDDPNTKQPVDSPDSGGADAGNKGGASSHNQRLSLEQGSDVQPTPAVSATSQGTQKRLPQTGDLIRMGLVGVLAIVGLVLVVLGLSKRDKRTGLLSH